MLDIKFVRENVDKVKEALLKRGYEITLDEFLAREDERREILKRAEELRNRRNVVSEEIGRLKKEKKDASSLVAEMKGVSDSIKGLDEELRELEEETILCLM